MPRYFMGGTRLADWERMMMDPSRSDSSAEEPQQNNPARKTPDGQLNKSSVPKHKPREDGV